MSDPEDLLTLLANLFLNYIIEGDLQQAERAFSKSKIPLQKYAFEVPPIHIVASATNVEGAEFLFARGFDLDATDSAVHGGTILHRCVLDGNVSMLKWILTKKNYMDLDATDDLGRTALHIACIRGRENVAHALIDTGVGQAILDKDGKPPRYYADIGRLASVSARLPPFQYNWEITANRRLDEARRNLQSAQCAGTGAGAGVEDAHTAKRHGAHSVPSKSACRTSGTNGLHSAKKGCSHEATHRKAGG